MKGDRRDEVGCFGPWVDYCRGARLGKREIESGRNNHRKLTTAIDRIVDSCMELSAEIVSEFREEPPPLPSPGVPGEGEKGGIARGFQ